MGQENIRSSNTKACYAPTQTITLSQHTKTAKHYKKGCPSQIASLPLIVQSFTNVKVIWPTRMPTPLTNARQCQAAALVRPCSDLHRGQV